VMRIEHVVQHIDDLADMEEDPEDSEDEAHQAEERRHLYKALETLSNDLTEKNIFADKLIETNHDDLAELTEHLLKLMNADKTALSDKQFAELSTELHHRHHHTAGDMGAAMANGLAIVTLFSDTVKQRKYGFARLRENVHLGEMDNKGVQFIFVIIEPFDVADEFSISKMDIARAVSLVVNQETLRDQLLTCAAEPSGTEMCIQHFFKLDGSNTFSKLMQDVSNWQKGERSSALEWSKIEKLTAKNPEKQKKFKARKIEQLKHGKLLAAKESPNAVGLKWVPEEWPLGGIKRDLKRRMFSKVYLDDWKDGFTLQSIAVVLFMFFACIAPAIAFGSVMAKETCVRRDPSCDGPLIVVARNDPYTGSLCPCTAQIGVIEMIISSGVCGIAYSLIGGSPLTILGGTGPVLVFTAVLFDLTEQLGVAAPTNDPLGRKRILLCWNILYRIYINGLLYIGLL
jgi:mannitol/fructose-specific phosphotransferase system IIA component (Ntr-type)